MRFNKGWTAEQKASYVKEWRKKHPERAKEWDRKNKEYILNWRAKHPEMVRATQARIRNRRRKLGFVPLNMPFEGCEKHHIDFQHVVFIPRELHESVYHVLDTGFNMGIINGKVFEWLASQLMKA